MSDYYDSREKQVEDFYNRADNIALHHVEALARKMLTENSKLSEFIMGMGTYYFTHIGGTITYEEKYYTELSDFIGEWDSIFKLTGNPMRFTATGQVETDW
jgi:hypothetical protein